MAQSGSPKNDSAFRVKGTVFRGHLRHLKDVGRLEPVLTLLSPEAAALVRDQPLPGSWVDAHPLEEVLRVVDQLYGIPAVWEMQRDVLEHDMLPFYFPMVQGIIRVLGTSPEVLFKNYQNLIRMNVRGMDFRYERFSDNEG